MRYLVVWKAMSSANKRSDPIKEREKRMSYASPLPPLDKKSR